MKSQSELENYRLIILSNQLKQLIQQAANTLETG